MRSIQCRYCKAVVELKAGASGVVQCQNCGAPNAVPREEISTEALHALRSGKLQLASCHFDSALVAYQNAILLAPEESEAYFGMALATFKVQYLKDEVNDCWQPICYDISNKKFTDDPNYLRALLHATDEQKSLYRQRGAEIDDIREEFYALKESGLDYDCFICVKVSDDDNLDSAGNKLKTRDSDTAHYVHDYLLRKGYKPFYSERDIHGRAGAAYEAMILYALYMSECMLVVCSNEDYLQTPWVKNEYGRFMTMVTNNEKERDAITFVFDGKPIEKLPNGKKIQGIDLQSKEAYPLIVDFVDKHTPEAKQRREEELKKAQEEAEEQRKQAEESKQKIAELERLVAEMMKSNPVATQAQQTVDEQAKALQQQQQQQQQLAEQQKALEAERKRLEDERARSSAIPPRANARLEAQRQAAKRSEEKFVIERGVLKKYNGQDKNVVIPDGVSTIGYRAFANCTDIKSVTLPDSVTEIESFAFRACTSLTEITFPTVAREVNILSMLNSPTPKRQPLSTGLKHIGSFAFDNCVSLKHLTIPKSVESIGKSAFYQCQGLETLVLFNGLQSIGELAFSECGSLKSVTIPNTVRFLGVDAFAKCKNLEDISIPKYIADGCDVGKAVFKYCRKKRFTFTN